jgi:hypothetical protein
MTIEILAEESNAACCRIVFFEIRTMHGAQDRLGVWKHLRPSPCQMRAGTSIEIDSSSAWGGGLKVHPSTRPGGTILSPLA